MNMTDRAIIKALEYCSTKGNCYKCYYQAWYTTKKCREHLAKEALDLIQRQQERIMHLETLLDDRCDKCIEREREDAVHSYREDLVEQLEEEKNHCCVGSYEDYDPYEDGRFETYEEVITLLKGVQNE